MAHYAFLNDQNIVTEVIAGVDENVNDIDYETLYANIRGQTCKRTSYNTIKGVHVDGGVPFRGTYACIGYTYDAVADKFYPPRPFTSWSFNETTYEWEAPVTKPNDGLDYTWNESDQAWELADPGPQPYPSWTFNAQTNSWDPPVAIPTDGNAYTWDEDNTAWVLVPGD